MIKILIISSGLNVVGGLEKMVVALANKLCERKYNVTLLVIDSEKVIFYEVHAHLEIKFMYANFGITNERNYLQRKIQFIKDVMNLSKEVNSINPEIVLSTDYTFTVGLALSQFYKKYKIICWEHSTFNLKKSRLWKRMLRWSYKKTHCIVALNSDEQSLYSKYNNCVKVIPNFIEPSVLVSDLEKKEILTIARLDHQKGIDLLLQTIPIVLNKHPDWKWKLIAAGNVMEYCSKEVLKYGWHERFQQKSALSPEVSEYKTAALYVMPSRNEVFGMVLIEAMNYGLPCISFDCNSGPRHIITDGLDGRLIEPESPLQLAEAVSNLIDDKILRKQMGFAAKQKAKNYYSESVIEQWEKLFVSLINHPA